MRCEVSPFLVDTDVAATFAFSNLAQPSLRSVVSTYSILVPPSRIPPTQSQSAKQGRHEYTSHKNGIGVVCLLVGSDCIISDLMI